MSTDDAALRAEIERLKAENSRLRDEAEVAASSASVASPRPVRPAGRQRWRAFASALCIIVAAVLVPVSIVGAWARGQLVAVDTFVATFAPLADDPDVQQLVIDQASAAIDDAIDVSAYTDDLFDGLQSLDLPPAANRALDLLRAPAADGVRSLMHGAIDGVVRSDAFATVWRESLVASHRALVAVATSGDAGAVVISGDGELGIQLGPIITQVKTTLTEQGFGLAASIPVIDRTIVVAQADALALVGVVYGIAVTVGWWLPVLSLVLFGMGITFARRRSRAVTGTGVGLALGGLALAVGFTVGATVLQLSAPSLGIPARTMDTIFQTVAGAMRDTAVVVLILGIVVALAGWIGGRSTSAARVRGLTGGLVGSARGGLRGRGLETGAFGAFLHRQRVLVRVAILVVALAVLILVRPLSVGLVLLVVALALLVWIVAALLEDEPATPADGPAEESSDEPVDAATTPV